MQIFQPAIGNLIFLDVEIAGNNRYVSVGRIGTNNDQLIRLLFVELQRQHFGLDEQIAVSVRQPVDHFLDEVDTVFLDILVGDINLAEGIQIGHFPENRIMIGIKFGDEDLSEVTALLLRRFRLLHAQGFLQRLVVDDPLLQQCISNFIGNIYVGHTSIPISIRTTWK